jgi:flagellar FliJ protein
MNQRLARLIQLLELKKEATRKAYQEVLKAQELYTQNKMRHEQLVSYREDYIQQLEVLGNEGTTIGRLKNRIDFINHLDTALIQLNTHLSQLAKARLKAELNFKQIKISEEGVAKIIERVKRVEDAKLQRSEQKESDEYAQKQWYSKNTNDE